MILKALAVVVVVFVFGTMANEVLAEGLIYDVGYNLGQYLQILIISTAIASGALILLAHFMKQNVPLTAK